MLIEFTVFYEKVGVSKFNPETYWKSGLGTDIIFIVNIALYIVDYSRIT